MKNWKTNLTPTNVAYALAIVALAVVHFWKPALMHDVELYIALGLMAVGAQVPPWLVRLEQIADGAPVAAAKKVPPLPVLTMIVGLLTALVVVPFALVAACSPAAQSAVTPVATDVLSCAVDIFTLVTTGNEDPVAVAKTCGMTLPDLIAYIDVLTQPAPDAGAAAMPDKLAKLLKVRDAAVHKLAAMAPGK